MREIPDKSFLKPVEVASLLGVSLRTLARWREEEKIDGLKLSRRTIRYARQEVIRFLKARENAQC